VSGDADDRNPFRMDVVDGLDRDRDLALMARGGKVILSSTSGYWMIQLTPAHAHHLADAIANAATVADVEALDGLDRPKTIEVTDGSGGFAIVSSPANFWTIKVTQAQRPTLAAAIRGAARRATRQQS
jgi:hypothetical protein